LRKFAFLCLVALPSLLVAQSLPDAPSAVAHKSSPPAAQPAPKPKPAAGTHDNGWPRTVKLDEKTSITIYQPQAEKWDGNRLYVYSATALNEAGVKTPRYGVVSFNARTEVDKVNREVTLDDLAITELKFPNPTNREPQILEELRAKMGKAAKVISLDRLQAMMATAEPEFEKVQVKNDPPRIIFSSKPAMLVTIDGEPQLRQVNDTYLKRVINTNSILIFEFDKKKYYLRVKDWWLESESLDGPWKYATKLPKDMKKAEEYAVEKTKQENPEAEAKPEESLKEAGKDAEIPAIYVVYKPAELVETQGEPAFKPITGTTIEYVANTNAMVLRYGGAMYALLSGRWFKSASLAGPWEYLAKDAIPQEFAKIPADSERASALVSVPGTPQAQEALIANSIPQTATITRSEAKLSVAYEGDPVFEPISGTTLEYARNTSAAVIRVDKTMYYAVEAGVWFKSATPNGPWEVTDSVPAEIYTIPPSSPLYYVTYAKVYGSTPEVVYVGYTPGYYGTVVSSDTGTVVYGTGWYYPPYVGGTWYGYPYTYGVGASFTWTNDSGWSFGFGYGYYYSPWYYPWYGPLGYYGYGWYPYYGWGAWGGAAVANVYGRWGNTAYSRTGAAWANPYTGNYGAASRGGAVNTANGRIAAGGRGYNTNIYTGNTVGYRGGAVYDPNSGIVAGAGAGFAGNRYTGSGTAGRGGFAYNTNTNTGIAAGKNNVYAGKDGNVYRYNRNSGEWSQNSGNGWNSVQKPDRPSLQNQQNARTQGQQRSQNFDQARSSGNFNRGSTMRSAPRGGGGRRR